MPEATSATTTARAAGDGTWGRWTAVWMVVVLALFVILALLGLVMRMTQGDVLSQVAPEWFYALLTLHGVGMVGAWYVGAMAGVSHQLRRYVEPSLAISRGVLAATVVGVVLLIAATLVGRFGTGWYFLHPLPFYSSGVWPDWATGAFFAALAVLGVAWTVWTVDLLRAIARRYTLGGALAWHTLRGKSGPETPPFVLVVTATLISALAAFTAAVLVLALYFAEWFIPGMVNDSLLMKNLIFFFGHGLVNITMYLGVALVYDLLPRYSSRSLQTNRLTALAWNIAMFLVLLVYFHHLYMDFAQPTLMQYLGQIGSYVISIPAAVISIFSTLYLVYRGNVRWTLTSLFLFFGVMGWAIGGVQAVIDSTISANFRYHNTLWVPSHFHTYYLLGVVMMVLAFAHHLGRDAGDGTVAGGSGGRGTALTAGLFLVGGYGLVILFAVAGALSVPRRYSNYPQELAHGASLSQISLVFIVLLLLGIVMFIGKTVARYRVGFTSP